MVLRRSRKTGSTPPWTELSGELCRERSQISIDFRPARKLNLARAICRCRNWPRARLIEQAAAALSKGGHKTICRKLLTMVLPARVIANYQTSRLEKSRETRKLHAEAKKGGNVPPFLLFLWLMGGVTLLRLR
jgi:hypothetical protein